jgi:hypothetical protein
MPDQPFADINHFIDRKIAIEMTTRYRQHINTILHPDYQGRDILPIAEAFNKKALQDLLNQADCIGLRFYYTMAADYQLLTPLQLLISRWKKPPPLLSFRNLHSAGPDEQTARQSIHRPTWRTT